MTRLTQNEINAICEALACRLAGEIEDVDQPTEVYQSAFNKMQERRKPTPHTGKVAA